MLPRQAGEQKPAFAIDCEQAHGPQRGRENHERPIGQSNGIAQGFAYLSPPESLRDGGATGGGLHPANSVRAITRLVHHPVCP